MQLRTIFLLGSLPFVFVGALIAISDTGTNNTTRSPVVLSNDPAPAVSQLTRQSSSREDELHEDLNMTRYMSGANATGPMFTGQVTDAQLQRSSDPAYVRELEKHQQDIDRMLGRGGS